MIKIARFPMRRVRGTLRQLTGYASRKGRRVVASVASESRRQKARRIVVGWLLAFLALEIIFVLALQGPLRFVRNSDYAFRADVLSSHLKQHTGQRFVVVLGSSRTMYGLRPDLINADPDQPFVFNFSTAGTGPIHSCVKLKHMLRDGIRPDGIVLELAFIELCSTESPIDEKILLNHDYADLHEYLAYRDNAETLRNEWLRAQFLLPCYSYRYHVMTTVLPSWNPVVHSTANPKIFDSYGWAPFTRDKIFTPKREQLHAEPKFAAWQVARNKWKAIVEILNVCRKEQIRVVVLFMPEGPLFRSRYTPQAEFDIREFEERFKAFPEVNVVNARMWLDDEDHFIDSHHIEAESAALFTNQFARKGMPLLQLSARSRRTATLSTR